MSYRFSFEEDGNVLIIVFEGEISPEEEAEVIREPLADPRFKPGAKILVDRTRARMTMTPQHVRPQIELIRQNLAKLGEPQVAIVASADYDFGMVRMFEMTAEDEIPHDLMVFRTVEEACSWLELDPAKISWP
jgi:succinyl-CoA synthetase alpha subunit